MADSSLITLTEITNNNRAARMAEQGWRYFNARDDVGNDADNCGICWKTEVWHRKDAWIRKLSARRWIRIQTQRPGPPLWSCNVVLKHVLSDRTLLVSLSHLPPAVQGYWRNPGPEQFRARKEAYTDAMHQWKNGVIQAERKWQPDGVLVVADWNLDLKEDWVREYLDGLWKECGLIRAWTNFGTAGSSLGGNRQIDGSYYGGMTKAIEPFLMPRVASSDHRPYKESFTIMGGMDIAKPGAQDPSEGQTSPGKPWWGFGDYQYDEMFEKVTVTDEGTVVTFDFDSPPY
jgi:hypothetical protein